MPPVDDDWRPPPAPAPKLLSSSALRLRVSALPTLWSAWATAFHATQTADGAPRPDLLEAFDAAVVDFTLAAREQDAAPSTILRVLDILAREIVGEASVQRGRTLRDRAGRVAMTAFYRRPTDAS
jgi:hypothetical protein